MSDDLELQVRSSQGEGPSTEFVEGLRKRIMAELAGPAEAGEDESVVAINLRPAQKEPVMTKSRMILVGLAAAMIAVVVGVVALSSDEQGLETIDAPVEPTTTTTSEPATTASPTTEEVATFAADASPLPGSFASIQPGSHRADDFLRPFAFSIEQSMFLQQHLRTRVAVSNVASRDPGDKDIVFLPLAVDYDSWLQILAEGLAEVESEETTLGGLRASRLDIEGSSCGEEAAFCGEVGMAQAGLSGVFTEGARYRIWVIEDDDQAPLAVIAGIWDESDIVWFDVADKVVSTLEFSPPEDE